VKLVRQRHVSPIDAGCYLAVLAADRTLTRLRRDSAGWGSDSGSRSAAAPRP
jgi:hypothetical protein